jgi:hypothetical protein
VDVPARSDYLNAPHKGEVAYQLFVTISFVCDDFAAEPPPLPNERTIAPEATARRPTTNPDTAMITNPAGPRMITPRTGIPKIIAFCPELIVFMFDYSLL